MRDASLPWLRAEFSAVMKRTENELRGMACLAFKDVAPAKKQVISSRSFGRMITSFEAMQESVATYMARAAEKLRRQQSVCEAIQVFVQTNEFRPADPQYRNAVTMPLANPSCDTRLLVRAALYELKLLYLPGFQYKKAGVILGGLSDASRRQESLFRTFGVGERSESVMKAFNALNERYRAGTITIAAAGIRKDRATRREAKTPNYTTQWVNCRMRGSDDCNAEMK